MKVRKLLAIAVVGAVLSLAPAAFAMNWTAHTHLSIHVDPQSVTAGQKVTISGQLNSQRPSCFRHKTVILYVDGDRVAADTTAANGSYKFTLHPQQTAQVQTKFAGTVSGVHPDSHTCLADASQTVTVHVN